MHSDNLEALIDEQHKKMHRLDGATILVKGKHNIKNELQQMHEEMLQVSYGIENLRKDLEKMKEQNVHCRELQSLIDILDKRIIHREQNVPPELIQAYRNIDKETCAQNILSPNILECNLNSSYQLEPKIPGKTYTDNNIGKHEAMKDCKRTLFTEPEVCPTIPFITAEEFNKVPNYIIGRQSLETINSLISAINQTLIAKYTILSMGKSVAKKKGEINLYLHYKKQEFDIKKEKGNLYFFTAEDYFKHIKMKIDKTKLNLITALRHCKRLRECRIKNELRYVITPQ